jgi:hypothetical protein
MLGELQVWPIKGRLGHLGKRTQKQAEGSVFQPEKQGSVVME